MSSWVVDDKRSWPEWFALKILQVGPIPSHLALIMDGNRRFAKQMQKEVLHGHKEGFKTLTNVLAWCRDIGITEVTAYAFSIENFKRSKEEVDGLMELACEKFGQLLDEVGRLKEHGICVRVIGKLDLLPPKLRAIAAKITLATAGNSVCTLNIAMAYTSSDEILTAMKEVAAGIADGSLLADEVTIDTLEHCLYTSRSPPPDIMLRTSGETRLSDFMLWQSRFSYLFFTKVLWPALSIWHLFGAIFQYQRHSHHLQGARAKGAVAAAKSYGDLDSKISASDLEHSGERVLLFKEKVAEKRQLRLEEMAAA